MPVRLTKSYNGQAAGTLYWGADQSTLRSISLADDNIEVATDYAKDSRITTAATGIISQNAKTYWNNSASAQTLTLNPTGYFPVGTIVSVVQVGAGATTVTPAGGAAIVGNAVTTGANKILQLLKGPNETWTGTGG